MWRILFAGNLLVTSAVAAETVNFEDTKLGSLPANWLGTPTGSGTRQFVRCPDITRAARQRR